ncbi:DUF2993 domain-containing protein [Leptolyngbya sp. NK1-12]|uniref:DUF2993 domain-containing protein n=1 Tax=Leptolyngbya sp. NK1-12 TaxID=2547451 RepID=A0AA97AHU5_9CYAN|nr:DUF2993 domain-containing protein [Leptolyngbya sp. NK1-12]WNZ24914.1 DUF2993 domain-containing protein [Leptolyngbya sp. NK1-12]
MTGKNQLLKSESDTYLHLASGSQMIGKVLSSAIRLWLRSQVEAVAVLDFQIEGRDRQILQGIIPHVVVRAEQVVYQGLHLDRLHLSATQIRINLGQVLQGKPLRLLQVVPVQGEVNLTQADLEASLAAPLLKQALAEILQRILQQAPSTEFPDLALLQTAPIQLQQPQLWLQSNRLCLMTEVSTISEQRWQISLNTMLQLVQPSCLQLTELELQYAAIDPTAGIQTSPTLLQERDLEIDLGPEVNLQQLQIETTGITCRGQINVVPG